MGNSGLCALEGSPEKRGHFLFLQCGDQRKKLEAAAGPNSPFLHRGLLQRETNSSSSVQLFLRWPKLKLRKNHALIAYGDLVINLTSNSYKRIFMLLIVPISQQSITSG